MQLNIYQIYYCFIFQLYFNDSAPAALSLKGKVLITTQHLPNIFLLYFNDSAPATLSLKGEVHNAIQHLSNTYNIVLYFCYILMIVLQQPYP